MGTTKNTFPENSKIIDIGIFVDSMFYISKGSCKVTITEKEKEILLAILPENVFFGEMSFIEDQVTTANVVTAQESEIVSLHRDKLLILFQRSSYLAIKFFLNLAQLLAQRYKTVLKQNLGI